MTKHRRITKPADFRGLTDRRGWKLDLKAIRERRNLDPTKDASIVAYIVEAPGCSVLYRSYLIMAIHLRDQEGQREAMKVQPNVTHELALFGLHMDGDLDLFSMNFGQQMLGNSVSSPLITPPLYAGQGEFTSDTTFAVACDHCIRTMVANGVDPVATSMAQYWSKTEGWISYMGIKHEEQVH